MVLNLCNASAVIDMYYIDPPIGIYRLPPGPSIYPRSPDNSHRPGGSCMSRTIQRYARCLAYISLVIVDKTTDSIVDVGTVFMERKFLRGLGTVGYIEGIAVDKKQQGKKLGLRIVDALTYYIGENSGRS